MPDVVFGAPAFSHSRSLYWLECGSTPAQSPLAGIQQPFSDLALGRSATPGVTHSGPHGEESAMRLATVVCASGVLAGNVYRPGALQGHLLSRSQLAVSRQHDGSWAQCTHKETHAAS